MAFRVKNANYNALRKLNLRERLAAANDTSMGQTLIQILSPTQISDLFPRYWIEKNPNISGFLKAIPSSMSAAKQRAYEEQIQNTASGAAAGANYDAGGYRKKWQKEMDEERERSQITRKNEPVVPKLSPEQRAAFDALKAGDIGIDDERVKWLKNAPKEVLKDVGIGIVKDDKGNEKFHYTAPQISDEDARKNLVTSTTSNTESSARKSAENYLGRSMSDNEWRLLLSTTKAEATTHKGETAMVMASILNRARIGYGGNHTIESVVSARGQFSSWGLGTAQQPPTEKRKHSMFDSASLLSGISHQQTDFASANPAAYNNAYDKGGGHRKIQERLDRGFTQVGGQIFNAASKSNLNVIQPDPVTRDYTPEQLSSKRRELESTIEADRLGKLAEVTQSNGPVNAAGPVKYEGAMPNVKVDYEKSMSRCGIGVRHIAEQMYGSKYFQGGLGGPASTLSKGSSYLSNSGFFKSGHSATVDQLKDQTYLDSLPVGTVISAAGGNERGEGHVQIKIGPHSWASDFPQGNRVLTSRRDGREYYGYTIHEPTKDGLDRLNQMGFKQTVSDTDTQHLATSAASVAASTPREYDGPPVESLPAQSNAQGIKPLAAVTQPQGPVNAAGPAAPEAPKATPTAAVEAPKPAAQPAGPTPERYNVNVNKFTDAIRQTEDFKRQAGMFGSMVPNSTIISGFNDDPRVKAAGVRLDDKGVMHFTKGMTPDVKEVMSTFDTKSFMTKIEEKKKEDVAPTKVKAMADGGKVPVNTEQITAYPIGGLRGDNAVVVNAHQKPLFTMNTNEDVLMDPDNNRAQVIPNKKGTNVGPMPRENMSSGIMEDFNSTIQEISKVFSNLKADKATKPDLTPQYPTVTENGWLGKLNNTADDPFKTPSIRRVAYRAGGMETGEPHSGFHHSRGNNS